MLALAATGAGLAQDPAAFYRKNCAACHSVGRGPMVGPDLKDVLNRRDRPWLVRFLENPKAIIDSGDAYARNLVAQSHGLIMPAVKGLDQANAEALLDFIGAQSKQAQQSSSGKNAPEERPFTAAEVEHGKEIVLGSRPLGGGGAPCMSCHTLRDLPGLGGGKLGPDLTRSYERLGGRTNMSAWLRSPPTRTMQAVYRSHAFQPAEILSLVAYFESASKQDAANPAAPQGRPFLTFLVIGLGGSLIGLVFLDEFWRNRFRAVRRPLVARKRG
ncbi:MAG TPA: cytochrome c [Bryobacteraceae bacterium]|nr:cytochrome c [Bryobacteraceae bacterium]